MSVHRPKFWLLLLMVVASVGVVLFLAISGLSREDAKANQSKGTVVEPKGVLPSSGRAARLTEQVEDGPDFRKEAESAPDLYEFVKTAHLSGSTKSVERARAVVMGCLPFAYRAPKVTAQLSTPQERVEYERAFDRLQKVECAGFAIANPEELKRIQARLLEAALVDPNSSEALSGTRFDSKDRKQERTKQLDRAIEVDGLKSLPWTGGALADMLLEAGFTASEDGQVRPAIAHAATLLAQCGEAIDCSSNGFDYLGMCATAAVCNGDLVKNTLRGMPESEQRAALELAALIKKELPAGLSNLLKRKP